MSSYPNEFSQELIRLKPSSDNTRRLNYGVGRLICSGLKLYAGVRVNDQPEIAAIARQEAVKEYCPKDDISRFHSEDSMAEWLKKGRGMFLLKRSRDDALAGYGWTGPEQCDEIPGQQNTFAIRLNKDVIAGKGIGKLFTTAITAGSMSLYGARNIGLETWGSNTAAVKTYLGAEAELVTSVDSQRPTLQGGDGAWWEEDDKTQVSKLMRRDVRLFMKFGYSFDS